MVERVARIICDVADYRFPDTTIEGAPVWSFYVEPARAAIEALGDPEEQMRALAELAVANGQSRSSFAQLAEWAYDQASKED